MTPAPGRPARREDLGALLAAADREVPRAVVVWLVGDTSQLWQGWLDRVAAVHLATNDAAARDTLSAASGRLGLGLTLESPGDVIPLPAGHADRQRPVAGVPDRFRHFDPYSFTFRGLARGDEPDYRTAVRFLRHGWMTLEEMDRLLEETLPRFTRETIAQDPAELRRKYRGLTQMWRAERLPDRRHRGPMGQPDCG